VSWAVDVTVVTLGGLIFDCGGVDGDTSGFFLRSLVDVAVLDELGGS
jgi:hypothetical protein